MYDLPTSFSMFIVQFFSVHCLTLFWIMTLKDFSKGMVEMICMLNFVLCVFVVTYNCIVCGKNNVPRISVMLDINNTTYCLSKLWSTILLIMISISICILSFPLVPFLPWLQEIFVLNFKYFPLNHIALKSTDNTTLQSAHYGTVNIKCIT